MPKTLLLTWLWTNEGCRTAYGPQHVNRWAEMVRRHCTLDLDIACVTREKGIDPSIRIIEPPGCFEDVRTGLWRPSQPQCYRRLALFRPDAADVFGAERIVSMDLDCLVTGDLDPLWRTHYDFRIYRGTCPNRPYNGSMVMILAGARAQVYDRFTPARAAKAQEQYVGSDQAWIMHCLGPRELTWGPEHGVRWYQKGAVRNTPSTRLIFFPGRPKPWDRKNFPPKMRWIPDGWHREFVNEAA